MGKRNATDKAVDAIMGSVANVLEATPYDESGFKSVIIDPSGPNGVAVESMDDHLARVKAERGA